MVLEKRAAVKIYSPAVLLYVAIATYLLFPMYEKIAVAEQVNNHLDNIMSSSVQNRINEVTGKPRTVSIERLNINLPVQLGVYDTNTKSWTLDSTHLFVSTFNDAKPKISTDSHKQPLKIVFYGHNTNQILLNTSHLVKGDILKVTTTDGNVLSYYYVSDEYVSPRSSDILHASRGKTPLVLITCDGLFSTSRRIMYFASTDLAQYPSDSKD